MLNGKLDVISGLTFSKMLTAMLPLTPKKCLKQIERCKIEIKNAVYYYIKK
jgi:hypothetical protein